MVLAPEKVALGVKLPAAVIVPAPAGVTVHAPPVAPPLWEYEVAEAVWQMVAAPLTVIVGQLQFTATVWLLVHPLGVSVTITV